MPQWQQLKDQAEEAGVGKQMAYTKSVWANRCIDIRANLISRIEWEILPNDKEDAEPLPATHEMVRLLREFNVEANWRDALRATDADLNIYGAGYWLKGKGWLQRLNPATMEVDANEKGIGSFRQELPGEGKPRDFKRDEIVYFHLYDPRSDLTGYSPSMVAEKAIEAEYQANLFLADFFENYAMPAVLLRDTQEPVGAFDEGEANRIIAWWKKTFGKGKERQGIGFAGGLEPHIIQHALKDMDLDVVRENARREICAAFGVPMSMAGAWSEAYQAAAEKERESIYTETIIPRAEYMADVINAELIPDPLVFRWKFNELEALQENENEKAERMERLVRAGIATVDYAADQMGVPEDQRGTGPISFQMGAGDADTEREQEEREERQPERGTPFRSDLGKWQRKALWRLEKNGSASCEFFSDVIPPSLNAAIEGSLKVAKDEKEVKDIFIDAMSWEHYPHTKEADMTQFKIDVNTAITSEAGKAMGEAIAEGLSALKVEVPVEVNVPRQEAPIVNIQQEPPVVNVDVPKQETPDMSKGLEALAEALREQQPPVVNVTVPQPKKITRKPKRNLNNIIEEVEETREY